MMIVCGSGMTTWTLLVKVGPNGSAPCVIRQSDVYVPAVSGATKLGTVKVFC
jgi:hypothetical protein